MAERRKGEDRRDDGSRGEERRMGDRRDSHRLPIEVEVSEGNKPFEKHEGNISIGGIFFRKPLTLPTGAVVQLRFKLPGFEEELLLKGEVMEITAVGTPEEKGTRVRFTGLDIKSEMTIARYLDEHME
jgi:uncharacterized protein (TIGR02266 family)